jgi:transcriptional regulator
MMFVPPPFRPRDEAWTTEVIRSFPLATLVTSAPDGLFATHLPTVLEEDTRDRPGWDGKLVGSTILGHMNRRNPQYRALRSAGAGGLLIFHGPGGYVSPTVYERTPAAPTWNFVAVHVRGTIEPIDDEQETRRVVRATAALFEGRFGKGWDMSTSLGYFDEILPGVGAFRMAVTAVDGMFKLSQDQPADLREKVITAFDADGDARAGLTEMMCRFASEKRS